MRRNMQSGKLFQKISTFLLAAIMLIATVACGGKTNDSAPKAVRYNLSDGKDLVLETDLKNCETYQMYNGATRLDKRSEYSYDAASGKFTVLALTMIFLETDETYTFRIETEKGNRQFNVEVYSDSNRSMNTDKVVFDYAAPADIVKDADFGEESVDVIKVGTANYVDAQYYSYSKENKTLTIQKEFLSTLWGSHTLTVRLTNDEEYSFGFESNLLYKNDFSDPENLQPEITDYPAFWGTERVSERDGWGILEPKYDHLFVFGKHYWGLTGGVAFEAKTNYVMEFDVKPDPDSICKVLTIAVRRRDDGSDPRVGLILSGYALDFTNGCVGGKGFLKDKEFDESLATYTYDEATGVAQVKLTF